MHQLFFLAFGSESAHMRSDQINHPDIPPLPNRRTPNRRTEAKLILSVFYLVT
jgi:hypothetical protein